MGRPGVMFYFDIRPCIKRLTLEEKGRLFEAILDYGEFGVIPDVEGALGVAWDFIQPKLDRDGDRYNRQIEQKQFAAFSREIRKQGKDPVSFDDWRLLSDDERCRLTSGDIGRCPTINIQPSSTTTTYSVQPTANDNAVGAGKPPTPQKTSRKAYGEFGWVKLTDDEFYRLLNDFGEPEAKRCIAYVDEAAQATGNKNKWKDWNLVTRRCHKQGWGLNQQKGGQHEQLAENKNSPTWKIGTIL